MVFHTELPGRGWWVTLPRYHCTDHKWAET